MAQFGRALRSGYHTERFGQNLPNCWNPLQTATLSVAQYLRKSGKYRFDHIKSHRYDIFVKLWVQKIEYRGVAQFGRALRSGRRGRRFKSCHLDQNRKSADENRRIFDFVLFILHYSIFIIH